jgi:5-methylcytosine-specific restriction endonuclease McrA
MGTGNISYASPSLPLQKLERKEKKKERKEKIRKKQSRHNGTYCRCGPCFSDKDGDDKGRIVAPHGEYLKGSRYS